MAELAPVQCVIIVLGKSMVEQPGMVTLRTEHKGRLARAAGIFHRKAAQMPVNRLRIVVTGYGLKQGLTEAEAMRQYLIFHCFIPPECILVEDRSRVTTLNIWNAYFMIQHMCSQELRAYPGAPDCNPLDIAQILYCKQHTAPQNQLAKQYVESIQSHGAQVRFPPECVLVTSDIHMPRARIMIQSIWAFLAREFHVPINVDSIQYAPSHHAAIFRHAGLHSYVHRTEVQKELSINESQLLNSINVKNALGQNRFSIIEAKDARFEAAQQILDATIGPQCLLPWNERDEPVYQDASCGVCFGFSHADSDLPINIGSLWVLVFHWDGRYQTRWFDSRDNALQYMERHSHLNALLLSPDGLISAEHFASDEWKARIYSQTQRVMHAMQAAYRAFHANTSLSVRNSKFDTDTEPSSIQYPVVNAPQFQPATNPPSTQMIFEGGFTRYEGSTIVMLISAVALPLYQRFHQLLISDVNVRAAMHILPPTSYHVTLRGISEVRTAHGSVLYNRNIHTKFAKLVLLDQQFADTFGDHSFKFGIFPTLSHNCRQFDLQPGRETESVFRGIEQLVVKELELKQFSQSWHISFGYFHDNPRWTVEERQQASLLIQRAQSAIKMHYNSFVQGLNADERQIVLQFQRPRVCCYQSMTEFNFIPDL